MEFERTILRAGLGLATLLGGQPATAAPLEPLIVTQLSDPDPSFVPPALQPKHGRRFAETDDSPTLDAAMQDFGRALGQAALLQQQAVEQRCRATDAASATGQDRLAWEAACRYVRR